MFATINYRKMLKLTAALVLLFLCIEFWSSSKPTPIKYKYGAEHLELLKAYSLRRTRKMESNHSRQPYDNNFNQTFLNIRDSSNHMPSNKALTYHDELLKMLKFSPPLVTPNNFSDNGHTDTSIDDLFIAVKTTQKYHNDRMKLLLDTWIPLARSSTFVITDGQSKELAKFLNPGHLHVSTCMMSHYRTDLVCKVSLAYDLYIQNPKRWLCLCDDDTYINVPNLVNLLKNYDHTQDWYIGRPSVKYPIRVTVGDTTQMFWFLTGGAGYCISRSLALKMAPYTMGGKLRSVSNSLRLPDDVAMGYIITKLLEVEPTRSQLFHSHLEGLKLLHPDEISLQITLSYGQIDIAPNETIPNLVNTGSVIPTLSPAVDPTRLKSIHCYMFPHTVECKQYNVV